MSPGAVQGSLAAAEADTSVVSKPPREWRAKLELGYETKAGRTMLVRRRHSGPLCVQKPFYPEGETSCHTYLLHPPAGIAGGDDLDIDISLQEHCHALITTPAATKFYRANPHTGRLRQAITMQENASLEWLPQENILFDGARALISTRVQLQQGCRLLAWDSHCLGRPACDEVFQHGECQQRFEIWLGGRPLLIDAMHLDAGSAMQQARWGLASCCVNSVMVAYPGTVELLSTVNKVIESQKAVHCAASLLGSLLIIRCLGEDMELVQSLMRSFWQLLRPHILDREACIPRVWNT